jgi:hypothetical protein
MCCCMWMAVNSGVYLFNDVLWSVNTALCVPSGKCSVCVHSTHSWCTVWKVLCSCTQYTLLMYRLESVVFLYTVHIPDLPSGKCSVSVHSTHSWCTVWKVFCSCTQYTLLMYRLESVLFLYTVHISDVPSGKCSVCVHSTHFWCTTMWYFFKLSAFSFSFKSILLLAQLRCYVAALKAVPVTVQTCNWKFFSLLMWPMRGILLPSVLTVRCDIVN